MGVRAHRVKEVVDSRPRVRESTVVRQRQRAETLLFGKGRKSGDSRLLLDTRRHLLLVFLLIL